MKILIVIFIYTTVNLFIEVMGNHKANANETLKRQKRIAGPGATSANFYDFRYIVSIENWSGIFHGRLHGIGRHSCGGSIVTPKYVLTAAHCVDSMWYQLPKNLKVRAGTPVKGRGWLYDVKRYTKPREFNRYDRGYDIAVLKLKTEINVGPGSEARVIPMVDSDFAFKHWDSVKTAGWGYNSNGRCPRRLQSLGLNIINAKDCNEKYYKYTAAVHGEICALSIHGRTLHGDSGGPVVVSVNNEYKLAGIVVRGKEFRGIVFPNIFTEVAYHREWIDRQINKNHCS